MLCLIRTLLFPRSRLAGCTPPTLGQRLAEWERRRGEHRARKALQRERVRHKLRAREARRLAMVLAASHHLMPFRTRRSGSVPTHSCVQDLSWRQVSRRLITTSSTSVIQP